MVVFVSVYQGKRTYLQENPSEEYLELSKKIRWVYLGLSVLWNFTVWAQHYKHSTQKKIVVLRSELGMLCGYKDSPFPQIGLRRK